MKAILLIRVSTEQQDLVQLIKKVVDKVIVSRNEKKQLHIEIYNKYNDNVEHIYLVRKWRNWVIDK